MLPSTPCTKIFVTVAYDEAGGADDDEGSDGEELEIDGSISSGSHPETIGQTRSRKEDSYRNPMFHMGNAEVEKAVARWVWKTLEPQLR